MQVEAYTATGVATGIVSRPGGPRDGLDAFGLLVIDEGTWYPLDGGPPRPMAGARLAADDVLVVGLDEDPDVPVHAMWHQILLDAGPFRITGELPTQPGFDPGRALARPGGTFVMLRDVRIEIHDQPNLGAVNRPFGLVNRYAIDRVAADLTLGFFFPGARLETPQGAPA